MFSGAACHWLDGCMGAKLDTVEIATLAPITLPEQDGGMMSYFGFTSVQFELVRTHHPPLYTVCDCDVQAFPCANFAGRDGNFLI